jgi:hypothetical protein
MRVINELRAVGYPIRIVAATLISARRWRHSAAEPSLPVLSFKAWSWTT